MDIILLWLFSTALPCWQIVVVSFDLLHVFFGFRTGRLYKEILWKYKPSTPGEIYFIKFKCCTYLETMVV